MYFIDRPRQLPNGEMARSCSRARAPNPHPQRLSASLVTV